MRPYSRGLHKNNNPSDLSAQQIFSDVRSEAQGISEPPHEAQLPSGLLFEQAYGASSRDQEIPVETEVIVAANQEPKSSQAIEDSSAIAGDLSGISNRDIPENKPQEPR